MARAGTAYLDFEGRFERLTRGSARAASDAAAQMDASAKQSANSWTGTLGTAMSGVGHALAQSVTVGAAIAGTAITGLATAALAAGANYNQMGQRATAA